MWHGVGYGATTLPGPTDALRKGDRVLAKKEFQKVVSAVLAAAEVLKIS